MTAEPWCKGFDEIGDLTDHQIEGLFRAQADAVKQDERPEEPGGDLGSIKRSGGQWDYLKSQGLSDDEAEAKLRKLRGG